MKAQLVNSSKIWGSAPHNAFTTLLRYNDSWFCAFREGDNHISEDGKIRILHSVDGEQWEGAALIESSHQLLTDLRDPKLAITPDRQVLLMATATARAPHLEPQTNLWFSNDGKNWGNPQAAGEKGVWLWSLAQNEEATYGVGYEMAGGTARVHLYRSSALPHFAHHALLHTDAQYPNETQLLLDGNAGVALIRREYAPGQTSSPPPYNGTSLLGFSEPPFLDWTTHDLGVHVGGPAMLRLPDGRVVVAGRKVVGLTFTTALWELDVEARQLHELLELPSGGDCSYPGLTWHDEKLWVSYYSEHEGSAQIYFAQVALS